MQTTHLAGLRSAPDGRAVSVLLIEDDEGDAVLVEAMLELIDEPIGLIWVRSLAEAQARIGEVDCALLDLGLPDTVGLDGVHRLREYAERVAVIVLTGREDEGLGSAAVAAGAQDYLVKGQVNGPLLARAIRYAVQRRHAEEIEFTLLQERVHAEQTARLEQGLLPRPLIRDPGVVITSRYRPGGRRILLGGDFYDVVEGPDQTLHMIIGDVAGHGPDQAALGVALRIAWRTLMLTGQPTPDTLAVMERVLVHERNDGVTFTTVCAMSIPADRRSARLYLAGHPAPVLRDGWRWSALPQVGGPALGLPPQAHRPGERWPATHLTMPVNRWAILLYSDGAIEGRTGEGHRRLGVDGLVEVLNETDGCVQSAEYPSAPLDLVIDRITELNAGPLTDDLALLQLAAQPVEPTAPPEPRRPDQEDR